MLARLAELADQIRDAVRAGDIWRPDYSALMEATGRKRSWCEKVVHDARVAVLEVPACTDTDDRSGEWHTGKTVQAVSSMDYQPTALRRFGWSPQRLLGMDGGPGLLLTQVPPTGAIHP